MTFARGISVIMPARNAAATIAATLDSLARQTRPPDEVIVVDDGSVDETAAMAQGAAARFADLRVLRLRERQGVVAARNRAIAESRGAFIAPLDADDLWHPAYLERMETALRAGATRPGLVYCFHRLIDERDRVLRDGPAYRADGSAFFRMLLMNFVGNGSAAVFEREALVAAGGYDPACETWGGAEDYLLQLKIAAVRPVACVPLWLVGYRQRPGSFSADIDKARAARLKAVEAACRFADVDSGAIRRWVRADADRVLAVKALLQRRAGHAMSAAGRALVLDPGASLSEGARRIANAARRRTSGEPGGAFLSLAPEKGRPNPLDPALIRRLAALRARDSSPATGV